MSRKLVFIALAAAFAAPLAQAHDSISNLNSSLRVFVGVHDIDYTEYDPGNSVASGILDTENGAQQLLGGSLGWQFTQGPLKNIVIHADARHAHGKTRYDGHLQWRNAEGEVELAPYSFNGVKAVTSETAVKVGYAFLVDQGRGQLTPYLAHGTYRWQRNSRASQYGYREDYRHDYLAAGVKWQSQFTRHWTFDIDAAYGHTRKAALAIPDFGLDFDLGASDMGLLQIALTQRLTDRLDMRYSLEAKRFGYGKSEVKDGMLEPKSDTDTADLFIGLGYRF